MAKKITDKLKKAIVAATEETDKKSPKKVRKNYMKYVRALLKIGIKVILSRHIGVIIAFMIHLALM